ncbi:hypothetical protein L0F63_001286, partial [Massospora cicadina]
NMFPKKITSSVYQVQRAGDTDLELQDYAGAQKESLTPKRAYKDWMALSKSELLSRCGF